MKTSSFLIFICFTLLLNSCKENETIIITPKKESDHQHFGKGVWGQLPSEYSKGKNYDGFQTFLYTSSVSLKIEELSSKKMRERFNPLYLKRNNITLKEFTEVKYGDRDSAFYTVVLDHNKNSYRHLLSIKYFDKVINIKGISTKDQASRYNKVLKKILLSTYIDLDEGIKEQEFIMADIESLGVFIFTKDGKFPTESPDQAILKSGKFTATGNSKDKKKLQKLLFEITGEKEATITKKELTNGYYQFGTSIGNGLYAHAMIIYDDNREGSYTICYGTEKETQDDCRKFVLSNSISVSQF